MAKAEGSYASPVADAPIASVTSDPTGLLMSIFDGMTAWTGLLGLFLMLVAYDQSKS